MTNVTIYTKDLLSDILDFKDYISFFDLKKREKYILLERLDNKTLKDIGISLEISQSMVAKIEDHACKKLKHIGMREKYNSYVCEITGVNND